MSRYQIYLEKNQNLMHVQDFSRYQRVKFKIGKTPFILDIDMVLEFGGVKVVVTDVFPAPQFPRKHDEVFYVKTRDKKYPFVPVFEGEIGREYDYHEQANIPHKLTDFMDVYIRKCDFGIPIDLEKSNMNPEVRMRVLDGPNKDKEWVMNKNLIYQMKQAEKVGKIPEVKSEYFIGKGIKNEFDTGLYSSKEYQATIYFDEMFGWCVRDDKFFWKVGPNYVYLANAYQLKNGYPSHLAKVQSGMMMCCGDYEFEWEVRNVRAGKLAEDIYDQDASLYLEEEEKNDIDKIKAEC